MSGRGSGRGAYYKALYGGGGRGRGRGGRGAGPSPSPSWSNRSQDSGEPSSKRQRTEDDDSGDLSLTDSFASSSRGTSDQLRNLLLQRDGRQYPAYKDLHGTWKFPPSPQFKGRTPFTLCLAHVQADPYASPSKFRIRIKNTFPSYLWNTTKIRSTALCDYLLRVFYRTAKDRGFDEAAKSGGWNGGKGGDISIDRPGQQVLERSAIVLGGSSEDSFIEARFTVGLPARGRSIMGQWAADIVTQRIPQLVATALEYATVDMAALQTFLETVEDQESLRQQTVAKGLVAFIANGSILPRQAGNTDLPMSSSRDVVPFKSPKSMETTFDLPNKGKVTGMAIKKGISLIAGGGFHGKSTLLSSISTGIYNHIPTDGRQLVVSDPSCVHVRVEDGRSVKSIDISPFISNLPSGKPGGKKRDTKRFETEDASGSTSMAAGVIEAIELGSRCLLFDEDTSATNFLIRDRRMQKLVERESEPITALVFKIRSLYREHGVSSILVIGGCGDYLDVADLCLVLKEYQPIDATSKAKEITAEEPAGVLSEESPTFGRISSRLLNTSSLVSDKVSSHGTRSISMGRDGEEINLSGLEQLVSSSQTRTIADSLSYLVRAGNNNKYDGNRNASSSSSKILKECVDRVEAAWDGNGLDVLNVGDRRDGTWAKVRAIDLGLAICRYRNVQISQDSEVIEGMDLE